MPKISSDYSNTIIYAIMCKDSNIKDFYIGHTTNLKNRIHVHKNHYSKYADKLLYKTIRECGGFDNWNFIVLQVSSFDDESCARQKEQDWVTFLNPTLNKIKAKWGNYDGLNLEGVDKKTKQVLMTKYRHQKEREQLKMFQTANNYMIVK